jgi:hypothetical protein
MNTQQQTVWMWKSNVDPQSNIEPDEWKHYSDIENCIIESAYQQNKNKVELDDYCINFSEQVQVMKPDSNKQRPIKRMTVKRDEYVRSERFTLQQPQLTNKSFSLKSYFGGMSSFLYASGYARNENLSNDELEDLLEKAAAGIEEEGTKMGKKTEAQFMANELRKQRGQGKKKIGECCIKLYTMESFLYKLFNQVMREAEVKDNHGFSFVLNRDKNYGRTLGPYCSLLCIYLHITPRQKDIVVFRGVELTDEMIDDYTKNVGKTIKWESYSSTTKNKQKALKFAGNTLFQIYIHPRSVYPCVDISSVSQYRHEEEVLLSPGIDINIDRVEFNQEINKHIIHMTTHP